MTGTDDRPGDAAGMRRHAEQALVESERRYRELFEGAPVGIFSTTSDGKALNANPAMARILGYASAEEAVKGLSNLGTDLYADSSRRGEFLRLLLAHGFVEGFEYEARTCDERRIWVSMNARVAARNPDGTFIIEGFCTDITERKRTAQQLQVRSHRLEVALRAAQAGAWDWDVATGHIEWSPEMFGLLGLDARTAVASLEAWRAALHPDDAAMAESRIAQALQQRTILNSDYRVVLPSGQTRWISAVGEGVYDDEGHPLQMLGICLDITDRKRMENELRSSEARFRSYFELPLHGIAITSPTKGWIQANDRICAILGYSHDELAQMTWSEMTHPGDLAADIRLFDRLVSGEINQYDMEKRFIRKDGQVIWTSLSVGCVRNPDGSVAYTVAIVEDISEKKAAEAALREAEIRYRLLFEHSPDGIVILDPHTARPLEFNETAHRQLGYTREEFARLTVPEIEAAETPGEVRSRIATVQREKSSDFETLQRTKQGEIRNIHVTAQIIEIQGKPVYHCVWRDITERKRAEAALRQSEGMFRSITENAFDMIALIDLDGRYLYCNPSYVKILGYLPDELVGRSAFSLVHADDREYAMGLFRQGLAERPPSAQASIRLVCQDGSVKWVDNRVTLLTDENGTPVRALVMAQDITERRRAEEALEHSRAQLLQAQKMEAVGRLAGGVAHDFNNILQALLSLATVLRLRVNSPELARTVGEIDSLVKRGASLTQQLLLFSRREVVKKERLDLGEIASSAGSLLRRLIPENVQLAIEIAPERLWVHGDAGQLQQVLMNLAVNARDAMPTGGRMTVRTTARDRDVVLEVADTGHGIDESTLGHIFEPFFTTKDKYKGSGLGLSVVHGIVEQHGGRIEVESTPGQGARFRVILPTTSPSEETATLDVSTEAELPLGHGQRVLLVEDEDGARRGLAEMLGMLGYEVTALASGEDAGQVPIEPAPDLLMTDLLLPGIGGSELAVSLRRRWPGLKVILMSGYTEDEATRRSVEDGTMRFIQKPFDLHRLATELRAAIEERE